MAARKRADRRPKRRAGEPPSKQRPAAPLADESASAATGPGFPVVGIGASAGGLAAFEAFFSALPAGVDAGMAFVLVQHLAPDHKSLLTDLVRGYTRMKVFDVVDGMKVQPDCAYVIPPNRDMAFLHGTLQLLEPATPRGQRLPIDFFFRSLAQDQRERAIGIVLSGNGRDGSLGVRAIKAQGGMAMVQNPESTEFDGMPRSAIATGLVDYVLPPAEMPARLVAYKSHAFARRRRPASAPPAEPDGAVNKVLVLLRARTGHDFSQYKPGTTHRRIERRMAVHQIESAADYVKYAQRSPAEIDALFRDLLIGVTTFFRDPAVFASIADKVIPKLLASKSEGGTVRCWVPGCSTGEEAYSLAILLAERLDGARRPLRVQIFATDIDSQAIATARAGVYPASIAAEVSEERLARFFTAEPDGSGYRIGKAVRDLLVFSEQDVIKDPPFCKLDLVSCRNLLIYLSGELQKRLIPLFHNALNQGGFLVLGTSEGVGECADLFGTLDRDSKLYQRKDDVFSARRAAADRYPPLLSSLEALPRSAGKKKRPRAPLRELTEHALLQQVAPAGALVHADGEVLYLHGRTGHFLEPAEGEAGANNLLKMAREGLRHPLAAALRAAAGKGEAVLVRGLRVKSNGHFTTADLGVRPLAADPAGPDEPRLYLVTFEEPRPDRSARASKLSPSAKRAGGRGKAQSVAALRRELQAREEFLRATVEELEKANEELKSSNEEMQSVNEELQSTNEEVETSKEELQSVNEELATVNGELQAKVGELSHANNDMINLMAGTGIGTVFVDRQLNILRFTPAATQVINFIATDIGRPIAHIVSNLVGYDRLVADVRAVLESLAPREIEVRAKSGAWYLLRIRPYRTQDDVVEGAAITFVDITELKELRNSQRLAVMLRDAQDALTLQALDGRILAWNPAAERLYGWSEAEALAMNARDRIPESERADALARVQQLGRAETLETYLARRLTKDGRVLEVRMTASALVDRAAQVYAIATTERLNGTHGSGHG